MPSQAVHDLMWVVNSPSFVAGENVAPHHTLELVDIDQGRLDAFVAERPVHRVGRYFENLLHFWFAHVRGVEIEAAGLQIRDGKRTIGELDFLYRNESGQLVHCEASVKFFLHFPRPGQSHYPGPNASDNFELKTNKLFDQQLEISRVHAPDVELREAFVKGMVFYEGEEQRPQNEPERMGPEHLCGGWIRAGDLDQLATRQDVVGAVCEKPFWLAPNALATPVDAAVLASSLRDHFAGDRDHPVMVSLRHPGTGAELERLFVVSNAWPT